MNVGELENAIHFKVIKYERIKFLVVGIGPTGGGGGNDSSLAIYAWV